MDSKKILVEVALLKAIEARNAVSLDSVLKQLQDLRDGKAGEAPARARQTAAVTPSPKAVRAEAVAAPPVAVIASDSIAVADPMEGESIAALQLVNPGQAPATDLEQIWASLVEAVGRASPFTRTYLLEAHPVSFNKSLFTIGFDPEFEDHLSLVDNARNHALLQTKLQELGHANTQIKFIKAEAPVGRTIPVALPLSEPTPASSPIAAPAAKTPGPARSAVPPKEKLSAIPFNKDDFKNDPLIQKALEIFKGQIVEVRA